MLVQALTLFFVLVCSSAALEPDDFDYSLLVSDIPDAAGGLVSNIKSINGFSPRPNWMYEMKTQLSAAHIYEIAIPGTHDSGSVFKYQPEAKWVYTQNETIWEQLVLGARYLDMRISYYEELDQFWVVHGKFPFRPLCVYLNQVEAFMSQTKEIVIFDIHNLPVGIEGHPERYEKLIKFLNKYVGKWMTPRSYHPNATLGEIWRSDKRLIVTFPSKYAKEEPNLWDQVNQIWENTCELDVLVSGLNSNMYKDYEKNTTYYAAMAEFTPDPKFIASNHLLGLEGCAAITNPTVLKRFNDDWWKRANIMAMDFLSSSGMVDAAIEANKARYN